MSQFRFLFVEDQPVDAEMAIRVLSKNNIEFEYRRVDTEEELIAELENFKPDLVISDYSMPVFDGMKALKICKEMIPELPFIILTGSINEETAVKCMKAGANDYLLKDNMTRLPFAVIEALKNAENEQQKRQVEIRLQESEARYKSLFNNNHAIMLLIHPKEGQIVDANPAACDFYGYSYDELIGMSMKQINRLSQEELSKLYEKALGKEVNLFQVKHYLANGEKRYVDAYSGPIVIDGEAYLHSIIHDVTKRIQAEKDLLESEKKYRFMFKNNPQPMWIYDLESLKFMEVNNAAILHYGYSKEEFLSMTLKDIRLEEDYISLMNDIKADNSAYNPGTEWRHKLKNGEIIQVEISSHPLVFNGRKARHVLINDITERKKAEAEIKLLGKAVEQSPASVLIANREGIIEYVNPKFSEITGYSSEEAIGKTPGISRSGMQDKHFYEDLWNTILSKRDWQGELINKRKNGELYWENVLISPLLNKHKEITHFVAVKEDISEKKKMVKELIAAKEKAEESDRLKSAFLANVSHEIRTPMNGILGFVDLLKTSELSQEEREKYFDIIMKSGARLLTTINDIIEISKIDSGQIELNNIDLNLSELMVYHFDFYKQKANAKGLRILLNEKVTGLDVLVKLDKPKMDSILSNLLNNAIKFTNEGTIEFGNYLKENELVFYVKDSGIGIPAERYEAVFERFVQADMNISRSHEGSGLGLSIVKAYVDALNGSIWFDTELGKGTTFYVSVPYIPFKSLSELPVNEEKQKPVDFKNRSKVLIAEDDEFVFIYLEAILEVKNLELLHCISGDEAVKIVKEEPDLSLVLMDIKMQGMNGLEATRQIRKFNEHIPIIAQTAYAFEEDKEMAFDAGCNDFISKPINKDELLSKIEKYLH